jgi:hypothetical protein
VTPGSGRISAGRRADGFLRNLRPVLGRAGAAGVVELVAARALVDVVSYRRLIVLATSLEGGGLRADLHPRRVCAREAVTDLLHTQLGRTGEPGVPGFWPEVVAHRLSAGHQLWVFHVDGEVAHARWVMRDRLYAAGREIPLHATECATEGAVTLPKFRHRGIALGAREHVRAVLRGSGTTWMYSVVSGVNRRFLAGALGLEGVERVATMHALRLGRRQWVRGTPTSRAGADLLRRAGLTPSRYVSDEAPRAGQALPA